MVDEVTEHGKCQRKPTGNPGFQSLNWWQHPSWEDSGCDSLTALTVYPVGRRKLYHLASFRHSPILQGGLGWLQCRRLRNERRSFFTSEGTCLVLSARLSATPSPGTERFLDVEAFPGVRHQPSEDMSRVGTFFLHF